MANKPVKIKKYIRGDSRLIRVTFYESDGVTPHPLTGGKAYFTLSTVAAPTDDSGALISLSTTSFDPATPGVATFTLTNALTQSLVPGTYYYDVQFIDANGNVTSTPQSTFTVVGDVTRRVN